jgi:DNA repair ATPase RecN
MNKPTQEELSRFVDNHVIYCVSSLVDDLFEKDMLSYDDIENLYCYEEICNEQGKYGQFYSNDELESEKERVQDALDEITDLIESAEEEIEDLEYDLDMLKADISENGDGPTKAQAEQLEDLEGKIDHLHGYITSLQDDYANLEAYQDRLEDIEEEYQEIYEWWIVDKWFARKLATKGQPILDCDYFTAWGRTCTGQSIHLDYVIEEIYKELQ